MVVSQLYRHPGLSAGAHEVVLNKIQAAAPGLKVKSLRTELCFYINSTTENLGQENEQKLKWLLGIPFQETNIKKSSFLQPELPNNTLLVEIGPRLNFSTAFSTNAVSICRSIDLAEIDRIEYANRYLLEFEHNGSGDGEIMTQTIEKAIVSVLHDRMTHCRYMKPIESFELNIKPEAVYEVDVLGQGRAALEKANSDLGLAFDSWDLDYYTELFQNKVKRNPTSVECFDLAQSNSEHSRHWFFKGRMVIDSEEKEKSLFSMIMDTQHQSNNNNVIKFEDNSSAIVGYNVTCLYPEKMTEASAMKDIPDNKRHIIFTAETHNFPTGVAPFPGATTGTGGRIRDVQACGQGAHVVAGTTGYCFGNLHIPGYDLPWEDKSWTYPDNFARPLQIAIEASNGASDYGNKFGEPVLAGFSRSYGTLLANGERREWVKPIMFSGGIGMLEACHVMKDKPDPDMEVVKIGGPVYRIGVGGGAASSIEVQGDNVTELDFGAVQRGDAEMEQKLNRVIRACIEMKERNPICSIHDQGAGGNGNVLKEICEPAGAVIKTSGFQLGDPTLSVMELWGAEYQESNAALVRSADANTLRKIARREKCPVSFVGSITGDGKIKLIDDIKNEGSPDSKRRRKDVTHPVDLDLEHVLGSMPRKVFKINREKIEMKELTLPDGLTVQQALERVLRLPSVASKRYLTNKVDRSVTGLVAQQQCVGPLHTPLADVAVTALSHFDTVGSATAIGEQPIKGLCDPACGARMSVGEALTNLVFARISDLKDVKCSGNWMWAAKLPGEGAALYEACDAMCDVMGKLGVAVDGGKDSLSMAARVGKETVKAPGALVVSVYCGCPDITATITPDLKCPNGKGILLYVRFGSRNKYRLGGSALAQCYSQLGNDAPDLDDAAMFVAAFNKTQELLQEGKLCSGHDISDGGLITAALEMAFAGNCGIHLEIASQVPEIDVLFAEELGIILEVTAENYDMVTETYKAANVICDKIGYCQDTGHDARVSVTVGDQLVIGTTKMVDLRSIWEETSVQLERLQANPHCIDEESLGLSQRKEPPFSLTFDPTVLSKIEDSTNTIEKPRIAVLREEGSNGDREMVAAFHMAGFEVWDVTMQDLCCGAVTLDKFQGIAFVGGFSYADVCGSAKGWAATLKYNKSVCEQFTSFYNREDTFSLGVCNGCQLMALLGWVAPDMEAKENSADLSGMEGLYLDHNLSERFESRFVSVRIEESPSIMLKDMANSCLGVWVAHGEGRMVYKTKQLEEEIHHNHLAPIRYVDDEGKPTTVYPLNPNGSAAGVAGVCSSDGRHLALMPHPERCVLPWQWPWMPRDMKDKMVVSPWLCMFTNAYKWCVQRKS